MTMREGTRHLRNNSRTRGRTNGKVRAVLSLGMLVGIAQVGTMAAWTDAATVESGTFATGTLDLRVGENAADQLGGQGGTWNHASLTLNDLAPGESVAQMLTIGNAGSIPLDYTIGVNTVDDALSGPNGLQITVVQDATGAGNTGSHGANDRVGSCQGGAPTAATDAPVSTSGTDVHGVPVALASGGTRSYCVVATLAKDAPNTMQANSTKLVVAIEAEQR